MTPKLKVVNEGTTDKSSAVTCTGVAADTKATCTVKTPSSAGRAACCGYYKVKADTKKADVTRTCGDGATTATEETQTGAAIVAPATWSCTDPFAPPKEADAKAATKLTLGLSAVAAALYMA